jgi:hypothetical protein
LREERRLRVLRRIFEPKKEKGTGEYRKLHNKELNDLYSSLNIIRVIKSRGVRWVGHVARMGRDVCRVLVGNTEGKRSLGKANPRRENNINSYLQELEWSGMDWIDLAQFRDRWQALVNAVMNLRVPLNAGKFLTI